MSSLFSIIFPLVSVWEGLGVASFALPLVQGGHGHQGCSPVSVAAVPAGWKRRHLWLIGFYPTTSSDRGAEGKVLPPQCKQGVTHGELTTASTAARSTGGQRMAAFSLSLPGVGRYSQAFLGLFCV